MENSKSQAQNSRTPLEIEKEMRNSPAYKVVTAISGLSRSIQLFEGNHRELLNLLNYFADARRSFEMDKAGHENLKSEFQEETVRLVHNYVSASLSLIDHTRNHFKNLYKSEQFPDYQERINNAFANNPLAQFVKGLRQYFQHYELPDIVFSTSWTRGQPDFVRKIYLRKEEIQNFDWKKVAQEYIDSQDKNIDLAEMVNGYHKIVVDFYQWFQERQHELHAKEFDEVEAFKVQMRRLAIPGILNGLLSMPEMDAASFEANILRYIGEDEKIILALMEPASKPTFLLIIFRSMAEISPAIENGIRKLWASAPNNDLSK